MAMRLSKKPVEKVFAIELPDYGKFNVTIRQARIGDDIRRRDLVAESSVIINDQVLGQEIKQKINTEEIHRFEVFLTMVDCDIEEVNDADEVVGLWFTFLNRKLADQSAFNKAYGLLHREIADAIYEKVLEVNPQWQMVDADEGE